MYHLNTKQLGITIVYVGFILMMITTCNQCKQKQAEHNMLEHVRDNLEKTSDELGRERASKDSIISIFTKGLNNR